jgi:hypothetical protein
MWGRDVDLSLWHGKQNAPPGQYGALSFAYRSGRSHLLRTGFLLHKRCVTAGPVRPIDKVEAPFDASGYLAGMAQRGGVGFKVREQS